MKLKDGFITHVMDGKQIMVATNKKLFSGLVRSNEVAAFMVDQLKKDTTEETIVQKLLEKYDVPKETAAADVTMILEKLRSIGALDE